MHTYKVTTVCTININNFTLFQTADPRTVQTTLYTVHSEVE